MKKDDEVIITTEDGVTMEPVIEIISSKQEVADELKMHINTLEKYLKKYPFELCGVPGKIMGRWRLARSDVHRWFRYVQSQEFRHPDSRRLRPAEPPELSEIKGR